MNSRIRLVSIFLALLLPAVAQAGGTIPAGVKILVVTDQSVSSKTAKAGQTVTGSVAHDVTVGGKTYTIATSSAGRTEGGKGKRDAGFIGGGAAGGAIIGALAGGGKGAAIGAAAGAGAGTAGAAATGKKEIDLPAETKLVFTTRTAVAIN